MMIGIMENDDVKAKLRQSIDESLKRVYEDALSQEIPDRFTKLLQQLREAEAKKKGQTGGDV